MGTADWTNMVPDQSKTVDYIPSTKKEEPQIPDVELRGKIEYKKKSWFERTMSDFRGNFPKMLFEVAIPEMGKILLTKTFDVIYNSVFGEPYYGGSKKSKGYFFNSSVVDYDSMYTGRSSKRTSHPDQIREFAYDEFLFTNKVDVDEIITRLQMKAKSEGKVSVSDLYSIIKKILARGDYPREIVALLKKDDYANLNYGWYYDDLRGVLPGVYGRDRYFLDLPDERPIK